MKKELLICLTAIMVLASCRDDKNAAVREVRVKGQTLTEIHIDRISPEEKEMRFSDFFDGFRIIPLETSDNCLIGHWNRRVIITETNIFFGFQGTSDIATLYRFDKDGNYLNNIGTGGRGPGEHRGSDVGQIISDDNKQILTVAWSGRGETMNYRYDGSYLGSIRRPMILLSGIYKWSDSLWFSLGSASGIPEFSRDSLLLVFYDNNGQIMGMHPRTVYPPVKGEKYTPQGSISIHIYNNRYKIFSPESDTVYIITPESKTPSEIISSVVGRIPYNRYTEPQNIVGKHDISFIAETDGYYLLHKTIFTDADFTQYAPGKWSARLKIEEKIILVDKQSKEATFVKLTDDVFGFLPEGFISYALSDMRDHRIAEQMDAMNFMKAIYENGIDNSDLMHLTTSPDRLRGLTQESNPVVITFTLKDHIRIE